MDVVNLPNKVNSLDMSLFTGFSSLHYLCLPIVACLSITVLLLRLKYKHLQNLRGQSNIRLLSDLRLSRSQRIVQISVKSNSFLVVFSDSSVALTPIGSTQSVKPGPTFDEVLDKRKTIGRVK